MTPESKKEPRARAEKGRGKKPRNTTQTATATDPAKPEVPAGPGDRARRDATAAPIGDPANDERKLARGAAIAIPFTTVFAAAFVGVSLSAGPALLVLGAGILLGTIALFWASLRTLTGDAPLSEALEHASFSATSDAQADRKRMLLRALKDLESEHAVGKIDLKDYGMLSARYREEIKDLMREMDDSIEPHVKAAEVAFKKHLVRAGLEGGPFRVPGKVTEAKPEALAKDEGEDATDPLSDSGPPRRMCVACEASNEVDARFCKSCGGTLDTAVVEAPKNLAALFDASKKDVDEPAAKDPPPTDSEKVEPTESASATEQPKVAGEREENA